MSCQFNHPAHDIITTPTWLGPMSVYDPDQYVFDRPGWCPARSNVADRLIVEGFWEPHDSAAIYHILAAGDRSSLVIDFGANAGWYTVMAAQLGYRVLAIDGHRDFIDLLERNTRPWRDTVTTQYAWVDETYTLPTITDPITLVKIDIEGNEADAVAACQPHIDHIHNFYIEISPEFRDDYPQLVDTLRSEYQVFYPDGTPFDDRYESQINLRFSR